MMNVLHAEYVKHYCILPHGTIKQSQIKCLCLNKNMAIVMTIERLISLSTYVQSGPQILTIQSLREEQCLLHPHSVSLKARIRHFQFFFYVSHTAACKRPV